MSSGDKISPQIDISKCMKASKELFVASGRLKDKIKVLTIENERQLKLDVQLIFLVISLDEIYGV